MATITNSITVVVDRLDPDEIEQLHSGITKLLAEIEADEQPSEAVLGWTSTSATKLLVRLFQGNRPVQAKVIHVAASNGGECDRDTVYDLGDYDESRSLKGFTRPVNRIMKEMQANGDLPIDAADPMKPIYDHENPSFQRAQGFAMPSELAALFATLHEAAS